MEAMMTIGDFARRTGLSISALRFYSGRGLLVPADVDSSSGYRLYSEAQVPDGRLVRDLRRLEMPLAEIERALTRSEPERRELINRHLRRLEQVVNRAHIVAQTLGVEPITEETAMSNTTLEALDLAQALDQVQPAAGTDPEIPHLMGVLIEGKNGSIRIVATDRHRLAIRDLVPSTLGHDFSVVVPAASLERWREPLRSPSSVELHVDSPDVALTGKGKVTLTGNGINLTALIMPTTFPDYERFLQPAAQVTSALLSRSEFLCSLEAFEGDDAVVVSTSHSGLSLVRGEQSVQIGARCEGPDQHVALNPAFAADAVRNAVGPELVMEIEDPLRAVVFRSADDGTYTSLVMPVKLD